MYIPYGHRSEIEVAQPATAGGATSATLASKMGFLICVSTVQSVKGFKLNLKQLLIYLDFNFLSSQEFKFSSGSIYSL